MATGFGFCPNCGAALTEAGQRFCAVCGFTLPVSAAAAAGAVPASAVVPPPPAGPPPAPPWAMAPVAPVGAVPPRTAVNPALILVGVLVIVAIGAAGFFAMNSSKASPSGSAGHSGGLFGTAFPTGETRATGTPAATPTPGGNVGSITFSPSKFDCSDTSTLVTMTARIPASVSSSEVVTAELDGEAGDPQAMSDTHFVKQSDGSWVSTTSQSASSWCGGLAAGKHTLKCLDSQGNVLAQGSFTNTGVAATPTPAPTPTPGSTGYVKVQPSTFSCSDSAANVTISLWLPASIPASEQVTAQTDGSNGNTEAVGDLFDKQSDGSWLLTATAPAPDFCDQFSGPGQHTLTVIDSHGKVLAVGSFTAKP